LTGGFEDGFFLNISKKESQTLVDLNKKPTFASLSKESINGGRSSAG
jgi:hypothetical protein